MIVLVDFENTHQSGFDGYEYLNERDTLVVYYSDENSALPRGMVDDLKRRSVNVKMVKLLKQHSNALDMYIASTTGMYLESGEKICIVSKDKGYAAVRDFWHSLRGAEILLGETIEECFLHSVQNDDERIRSAKERYQKVQITQAFETMNRVPTRPTLSRGNRRRLDFDTNRNLEPIELLPNPLSLSKPEETEQGKPETEEKQTAPKAESEKPRREIPAEKPESREPEKSGEPEAPASAEKTVSPAPKPPVKRNEAAISYVYDPVTRTMKQVGGAPAETAAETAVIEESAGAGLPEAEEEKPAHKKRRRRRRKPAGERAAAELSVNAEEGELPAEPEETAESGDAESQPAAASVAALPTETMPETAVEPIPTAGENTAEENSTHAAEAEAVMPSEEEAEKKPKRRRRKSAVKKAEEKPASSETPTESAAEKTEETAESAEKAMEASEETKPKRRGRKPAAKKAEEKKEEKKSDENKSDEKKTAVKKETKPSGKKENEEAEVKPKRRGRKPAAKKAEAAAE